MTDIPKHDAATHDAHGRPLTPIPRDGPLRPPVKRFYKAVTVGEAKAGDGFRILLDGRMARTPGKSELALPTRALAERVAAEWAAQQSHLDPLSMPLTRLVNTAIDGVEPRADAVRADLVAFAGSDLVCYRASHPVPLRERQSAAWDAVIAWARSNLDVTPRVVDGIMPVEQPPALRQAVAARLAGFDPFQLAALHVMTTLTGSLLLALGVTMRAWTAETAWARAHVDEDWQTSQWGEDADAAIRRRNRWADMQAAALLLELLGLRIGRNMPLSDA